ncbi:MAG: hypothetical protein RID59_16015 [Hoeflea sp.]
MLQLLFHCIRIETHDGECVQTVCGLCPPFDCLPGRNEGHQVPNVAAGDLFFPDNLHFAVQENEIVVGEIVGSAIPTELIFSRQHQSRILHAQPGAFEYGVDFRRFRFFAEFELQFSFFRHYRQQQSTADPNRIYHA